MSHRGSAKTRGSAFTRSSWVKLIAVAIALLLVVGAAGYVLAFRPDSVPAVAPAPDDLRKDLKPGHVFVINLENTGFDRAWGPDSQAPYLSRTLRDQGVLLENYYAIRHSSLPNYIAQISGQGSNVNTMNDCAVFHRFTGNGTTSFGQAQGKGCVYQASIPTLVGQMEAKALTWRGYMEDMARPCLHPNLGAADSNKKAVPGDQYATRHNPFVYFASIINNPSCAKNVVNFSALPKDLENTATTRNLTYITPNLCNDGHDEPCVDGRPGGMATADAWLKKWVPLITDSPAFQKDGMLVITFDEGDGELKPGSADTHGDTSDQGPGAPSPEIFGKDGGRIGALIISPFVRPGTSSEVVYNHYSLLASIEDAFSLPYIGFAQVTALNKFGEDVYTMD